jgi:uncharacterized protein DUF4276
VSVRIYVEGGGEWAYTKTACRAAFHEFFRKFVPEGRQPKVIASGGRENAFSDFKQAVLQNPDQLVLLLVDAEGPVAQAATNWAHLRARDQWNRPPGVSEDQAQLMVQCMESWFLADRDALKDYYGDGFLIASIPGGPIESVAKNDVLNALQHASRNTRTKGKYHKTIHGFDLLARIDPRKVRAASRCAERLCTVLGNLAAE